MQAIRPERTLATAVRASTLLASSHSSGATAVRESLSPTPSSPPVIFCCVSRALLALGTRISFQLETFPISETIQNVHGNIPLNYFLAWEPLHSVWEFFQPAWTPSHLGSTTQRLTGRTGAWKRVLWNYKERQRALLHSKRRFLLEDPSLMQIPKGKRQKHECDAHYRYSHFSTKVSMKPKSKS